MARRKIMRVKLIRVCITILLFSLPLTYASPLSSSSDEDEDKVEPYSEDEFPTWAHDIRRAEIITIGSLPFTTLASTLCYSLGRYAGYGFDFDYVPNPFAKSGVGALNQSEQIGVFATAGGLSIAIGITDLIIHIVRRRKIKRLLEEKKDVPVIITPLESDNEKKHPPPIPIDSTGE